MIFTVERHFEQR